MEQWPYADKRVVVLSSHRVDFSAAREFVNRWLDPRLTFCRSLLAAVTRHVYVDGESRFQGSCGARLIQRLVITRCRSSLVTGFLFLAPCRATFDSVTSPRGTILAACSERISLAPL